MIAEDSKLSLFLTSDLPNSCQQGLPNVAILCINFIFPGVNPYSSCDCNHEDGSDNHNGGGGWDHNNGGGDNHNGGGDWNHHNGGGDDHNVCKNTLISTYWNTTKYLLVKERRRLES